MDEREGSMASHRPSILQLAGLWQVQMDRDQLWEKPPGGRNPSPDFFMTYTADEVFACRERLGGLLKYYEREAA